MIMKSGLQAHLPSIGIQIPFKATSNIVMFHWCSFFGFKFFPTPVKVLPNITHAFSVNKSMMFCPSSRLDTS
jgi:hypothetical protein